MDVIKDGDPLPEFGDIDKAVETLNAERIATITHADVIFGTDCRAYPILSCLKQYWVKQNGEGAVPLRRVDPHFIKFLLTNIPRRGVEPGHIAKVITERKEYLAFEEKIVKAWQDKCEAQKRNAPSDMQNETRSRLTRVLDAFRNFGKPGRYQASETLNVCIFDEHLTSGFGDGGTMDTLRNMILLAAQRKKIPILGCIATIANTLGQEDVTLPIQEHRMPFDVSYDGSARVMGQTDHRLLMAPGATGVMPAHVPAFAKAHREELDVYNERVDAIAAFASEHRQGLLGDCEQQTQKVAEAYRKLTTEHTHQIAWDGLCKGLMLRIRNFS